MTMVHYIHRHVIRYQVKKFESGFMPGPAYNYQINNYESGTAVCEY